MRKSLSVEGLRRSEAYRPGDTVSFDKSLRRQDLAADRSRATRVSRITSLRGLGADGNIIEFVALINGYPIIYVEASNPRSWVGFG
jgi:hypothetical protein